MRRRDFIALGSAAAAGSIEARAQQLALPVVGFLGSDSPELYADRLRAFRRGLKDAGYIESENVVIEYRWANGDNNRLAGLPIGSKRAAAACDASNRICQRRIIRCAPCRCISQRPQRGRPC